MTMRAPEALTDRSRRLWRRVCADYVLSDAELEVLRSGLEALDRADAAATRLKAEGLTVADRYGGMRPHPCVEIESKNRALFARSVAQLGIKAVEKRTGSGAKPGPRPRLAARRAG